MKHIVFDKEGNGQVFDIKEEAMDYIKDSFNEENINNLFYGKVDNIKAFESTFKEIKFIEEDLKEEEQLPEEKLK